MEAQDWPAQDLQFEAFYCLVLGASPLGDQGYSPYAMIMTHSLQWVWAIMGTDVQEGVRGRNRGDRYRTHHGMEQELLVGLYPYFTGKKFWSVTGSGTVVGTDPSETEAILWTPPIFRTRVVQEPGGTGLTYGSAAVELTDMTEVVAA